jgi:hypothetical protein
MSAAPLWAQHSAGLKLGPNISYLRSGALKQSVQDLQSQDPTITEVDARVQSGVGFTFGGYYRYDFANKKGSILVEPAFMYTRSYSQITYKNETVEGLDTVATVVLSDATWQNMSFALPISYLYHFAPRQKAYFSGGLTFQLRGKVKLNSSEDSTKTYYLDDEIDNGRSYTKSYDTKATMEDWSSFNLFLHAGIGKQFLMGRYYNLDVEFRYQYGLLSSTLSTNSQEFYDNTLLNGIYSEQGAEEYKTTTGDDIGKYRQHLFSLNIRYTLWSK